MAISLLLISLLSSSVVLEPKQTHPSEICPGPENISPCICIKACPACPATIECSGIRSADELRDVFDKSSDYTFWNFLITNSTFQYLPAEAIDIKRVRNLYLRNNIMYALFEKPPSSTNLLEELELTNVTLQGGIRWDVFTSLNHLKEFNVSDIEISRIDQSFLSNFPVGLTGLFFTDTKTRQLGETAFAKLEDLTRIFVRRTHISVLQRSMFPETSKLIAMTFSGNKISSLPDDVFTNMPDLVSIDFSFTNIATLTSDVFENIIPRLRLMYFEGNAIDCGCAMKWVTKLKELPYYLKVTCRRPALVEGLSIKELRPNHFVHCE